MKRPDSTLALLVLSFYCYICYCNWNIFIFSPFRTMVPLNSTATTYNSDHFAHDCCDSLILHHWGNCQWVRDIQVRRKYQMYHSVYLWLVVLFADNYPKMHVKDLNQILCSEKYCLLLIMSKAVRVSRYYVSLNCSQTFCKKEKKKGTIQCLSDSLVMQTDVTQICIHLLKHQTAVLKINLTLHKKWLNKSIIFYISLIRSVCKWDTLAWELSK